MHDFSEAKLRNCVEADDATDRSLQELDIFFLRTLHVYDVDGVVARRPSAWQSQIMGRSSYASGW